MFYELLFFTALSSFIILSKQQISNEDEELSERLINDSIVEFYNNCTCIEFFECSEANDNSFAKRIKLKRILCYSSNFVCCKLVSNPEKTVTSTIKTTSSVVATTMPNITERRSLNVSGCGIAKSIIGYRILTPYVSSATTIPGEMPWMVEIFQKSRSQNVERYKLKCAGSLIHPKVVLTATHCVTSNVRKPQALKVVANGKEFFQNVGVNPEDERNVLKVIKHPDYYSGGFHNDIALLILDREYSFSNTFQNSICIPKINQTFIGKCLAAGWGENENLEGLPLRKVDVPIVDRQECQNLLRRTSLGADFSLHSSFICAGGEEGKDTCKGDGGGPLICLGEEYEFVIAGIVSWGVPGRCGVANQPGVYTDVTQFTEWIQGELSKN